MVTSRVQLHICVYMEVCETITCNDKVRYARGIFNTPRDTRTLKKSSSETAIVVITPQVERVNHAYVFDYYAFVTYC